MKTFILSLIFISLLISCKKEKVIVTPGPQKIVQIHPHTDTIYIPDGYKEKYDSLLIEANQYLAKNDSLTRVNKIIGDKLLYSNLMIENARYYLNLSIKNPSQDKFLKGWMRRALEVN